MNRSSRDPASPSRSLPILIYDGDCGFCTRCIWRIARLPVRAVLVPWQEVDLASLGTTADRARREVLWVDARRQVHGGAAALAALLRDCNGGWPLLGAALSAPLIRWVAAAIYRQIARNRYRLPGIVPACQLPAHKRPGFRMRTAPNTPPDPGPARQS